jgi:hypothetical protein
MLQESLSLLLDIHAWTNTANGTDGATVTVAASSASACGYIGSCINLERPTG